MLLALMKHRDQPSAEQNLPPPVTLAGNQVKWPNPNNDNRGTEMGACYGLTKYSCNRSHQIQLRRSSCNTHVECGVSFLHIYREIQLGLKRLGAGVYQVRKISTPERTYVCTCKWISEHFKLQSEKARASMTVPTFYTGHVTMKC